VGRFGPADSPTYLDEHHETVLNALQHATDLVGRESWESTFWVRSYSDALALQRMLRKSVFAVTERVDQPVLACVGLVRARRPSQGAASPAEETWGVFVTVRPN